MHSNNQVIALIGKNGSGKSRELSDIIKVALHRKNKENNILNIVRDNGFSNILSLATTPFDKFPLKKSKNDYIDYHYLGVRGVSTYNLSSSYLNRIIEHVFLREYSDRRHVYSSVLSYLGCEGFFSIELESNIKIYEFYRLTDLRREKSNKYLGKEFISLIKRKGRITGINKNFYDRALFEKQEKIKEAMGCLEYFFIKSNSELMTVIVDDDGPRMLDEDDLPGYIDWGKIATAINYSLLRVRGIYVRKNGRKMNIGDASSGEQTIFLSFLGLASKIRDNSLVLIDEPETNLHPEWQEKYIDFMLSSFSNFFNCTFILATHSPQILSSIKGDDNLIVMMDEKMKVVGADHFHNKSVDYQLANAFKKPGFKNEYMSRVLIAAIAEFSKTGEFRPETISEVKPLLELRDKLSPDDPTIQLVDIVAEALEDFSNDS